MNSWQEVELDFWMTFFGVQYLYKDKCVTCKYGGIQYEDGYFCREKGTIVQRVSHCYLFDDDLVMRFISFMHFKAPESRRKRR